MGSRLGVRFALEKERWMHSFFSIAHKDGETSEIKQVQKATAIILCKSAEWRIIRFKNFPVVEKPHDLFQPYTSYGWSQESTSIGFSPMKKYIFNSLITKDENGLVCSTIAVSPCILNLFYIDGPVAPASKIGNKTQQFHHGGFLSPTVNNRKFDIGKAGAILESYKDPSSNEGKSGLGAYHLFGFATEKRDPTDLAPGSSLFDNYSPIQSLTSLGQVARNLEMKDCELAWEIFVSCFEMIEASIFPSILTCCFVFSSTKN